MAVGSDHTDRELEETSILKSKQVYPNIISSSVWRYRELLDHWDELMLRSWTGVGRQKIYQEAPLAALMRPEELLERVKSLVEGDLTGTVIYSGTVAANENLSFTDFFEVELADPKTQKSLACAYVIRPIRWFKGEL